MYPVTPAQVGYELEANKIRTGNAILFNGLVDENFIEKEVFKKQENNYGKTVKEVIKFSESPLIIGKSKYSLFLETLITIKRRNPVSRQLLINVFKNAINDPGYLPQLRSSLGQEFGEENLPKEIDEYLKIYLYSEARNNDRLYDMYLSAYANQEYTTIRNLRSDFYSLKQYILRAPIGSQFITSDNPGYTLVNGKLFRLGGFKDTYTFYFPLSPATCLFLKSSDKEKANILEKAIYPTLISESEVRQINNFTKIGSDRYILAREKSQLK